MDSFLKDSSATSEVDQHSSNGFENKKLFTLFKIEQSQNATITSTRD